VFKNSYDVIVKSKRKELKCKTKTSPRISGVSPEELVMDVISSNEDISDHVSEKSNCGLREGERGGS